MTLALRIFLPGASVLLGDMLVSGDGDSNITLLTVGHIRNVFPEGSGLTPYPRIRTTRSKDRRHGG